MIDANWLFSHVLLSSEKEEEKGICLITSQVLGSAAYRLEKLF